MHRGLALRLAATVATAGDPDAGDQASQVPLPSAGMGLVEVVQVHHQVALGRCVEAEVAEVRVAADHRGDAGGGQPGDVDRHHVRRAAQETVWRGCHPANANRNQLRAAAPRATVGPARADRRDRPAPSTGRVPCAVLRGAGDGRVRSARPAIRACAAASDSCRSLRRSARRGLQRGRQTSWRRRPPAYSPRHTGGRFSLNARTPSRKSSLP